MISLYILQAIVNEQRINFNFYVSLIFLEIPMDTSQDYKDYLEDNTHSYQNKVESPDECFTGNDEILLSCYMFHVQYMHLPTIYTYSKMSNTPGPGPNVNVYHYYYHPNLTIPCQ